MSEERPTVERHGEYVYFAYGDQHDHTEPIPNMTAAELRALADRLDGGASPEPQRDEDRLASWVQSGADFVLNRLDHIAEGVVSWMPEEENEKHHHAVEMLGKIRLHVIALTEALEPRWKPQPYSVLGEGATADPKVAAYFDARGKDGQEATESPTREILDRALGEVLFNASNHPNPSAVLGRDFTTLREKCVDAVMKVLPEDALLPSRATLSTLLLTFLRPPKHGGGPWTFNPDGAAEGVPRLLPGRTEGEVLQGVLGKRDTPVLRFETTEAQDGLIRMMESSLRHQLVTAIEAKRDEIVPANSLSSTGLLIRQGFNDAIEIVRTKGQIVAPEEDQP